jgi:hypothetical protein
MTRGVLIPLGVAFFAATLAYLAIYVFAPTMYVEKAFNILAIVFLMSGGITSLVLMTRKRS